MDQSEDEREDGEIVDDEFDEISDYSIQSDGKSDYSQDLLRPISLSSISDSDGEREYLRKYYLPARKRNHRDERRHRKKRKKSAVTRKSRDFSSSESDSEKVDIQMLRQLKEAVRIDCSKDLHHNSLKTRLKGMIDPDSQDEEIEALRNLALITSKNKDQDVKEENEDDSINDKELALLRQEALKSAILKKHLERKRRKELISNPEPNKENTENNIIQKAEPEKIENLSIEEDVDVMRAMLLASMSKKITSMPITSTPLTNTVVYNKPTSIKPIIINLNSDSDSESDKKPSLSPIDKSVTAFLKKQREQFEAKCEEKEQSADMLLDKSVVKLLSKAQQKEYKHLKQKLWLARKRKLKHYMNKEKGDGEKNKQDGFKKTLQELQFQKDGRLQTRGKYKELAPLIEKVNQASTTRKIYEERIKKLLKDLHEARSQLAEKHQNFTSLVQQLIKEKKNIDLRLSKFALTNPSTKPKPTSPKKIPLSPIKTEVVKPVKEEIVPSENDKDLKDIPNHSKYVSPLDHRESQSTNPLQMLCPYELFGVCKDPECNFNHCP